MLDWNENDLVTCLEVTPHWNEDAAVATFFVKRAGLVLVVELCLTYRARILVLAQGLERPVVEIVIDHPSSIRHVFDKRGDYLEFAWPDTVDAEPVRVFVKPCIQVVLAPPATA